MNTWTIPADVTLPTEVGATVHIAVEGEFQPDRLRNMGSSWTATTKYGPPSVLSALLGKRCETCGGVGWVVEGQTIDWPAGEQIECEPCAGTGVELVTLQRECDHTFRGHKQMTTMGGAEPLVERCTACLWKKGLVSLPGRWKLESLLLQVEMPSHANGKPFIVKMGGGYWMTAPDGGLTETSALQEIDVLGTPQPGQWVATFTLVDT